MKIFSGILNLVLLFSMVVVFALKYEEAQAQSFLSTIDEEQRYCLQQNVYFEARNQSTLGKVAVAWVTINRVESERYPNSICEVVWQNRQFSWTHDGKPDRPGRNVIEQQAWESSGHVVESVLIDWAFGRYSPVGGATHYHADYVNPHWSSAYERVAQIDSHIFYQ